MIVSETDIQNNFDKYLQAVQIKDKLIIRKDGIEVTRPISKEQIVSPLLICLQEF